MHNHWYVSGYHWSWQQEKIRHSPDVCEKGTGLRYIHTTKCSVGKKKRMRRLLIKYLYDLILKIEMENNLKTVVKRLLGLWTWICIAVVCLNYTWKDAQEMDHLVASGLGNQWRRKNFCCKSFYTVWIFRDMNGLKLQI